MRKRILLLLGAVLVLAVFSVIAYAVEASQPSPSFTGFTHPLAGKVGDSLETPEGAQVTLLATELKNGQLRFHLKVHNTQSQALNVWKADADHGFALYNTVTKTFVIATTPISASDAAAHSALPDTVAGQGDANGWVAFAVSSPSPYDSTLFYRYRTVPTLRCPNPGNGVPPAPPDRSKCQPVDLYSTVHWSF